MSAPRPATRFAEVLGGRDGAVVDSLGAHSPGLETKRRPRTRQRTPPTGKSASAPTHFSSIIANSTELPDLTVYSAPLVQILEAAKDGIAGSLAHRGVKQEATKTLKEVLTQGKVAASRLRSALRPTTGRRASGWSNTT